MNDSINNSCSYLFSQSNDNNKPDTNQIILASNDAAINKLSCINFKIIKSQHVRKEWNEMKN